MHAAVGVAMPPGGLTPGPPLSWETKHEDEPESDVLRVQSGSRPSEVASEAAVVMDPMDVASYT